MKRHAMIATGSGLLGLAFGAVTAAAMLPEAVQQRPYVAPAELRAIEIRGVRLGMPLAEAGARLERLGMVPQREDRFPPGGSVGHVRYATGHGVPLVDLIYHRVGGVTVVTGLGLQEDLPVTRAADRDRLIRSRYGAPTWVARNGAGPTYHWIPRGWPRSYDRLEPTRSCLSVFVDCVEPNVPQDCPAALIHRGVVMSVLFGGGAPPGTRRLYVNLWDTAAQFEAVYNGRDRLPARAVCIPPIFN